MDWTLDEIQILPKASKDNSNILFMLKVALLTVDSLKFPFAEPNLTALTAPANQQPPPRTRVIPVTTKRASLLIVTH
ncbi:hypothetical protein HUJ04_009346 [Dendroctonus ponderosae]|nr:hypothetical protein HUJ04_009346 [Dendroctonus ponderosae]